MPVLTRRSRPAAALVAGVLLGAGLFGANLAAADDTVDDNLALGGNFEIDSDANLVHLNGATTKDWFDIPQGSTPGTEIRKQDTTSGTGDESFGQGTKEDTPVPTKVTGSIPPNKSDLKWFGVYQEGTSSSGFLNLYWSRVQDPQGTTNMDFEFNKNKCVAGGSGCSGNGITPLRSQDDLLITYDLSNGGTVPTLSLRKWNGDGTSGSWGTSVLLTGSGDATGSINTSSITSGEADGLGAHSPRTFGEAQIRLDRVLPTNTCTTFGSAYLKSRSSDSFTAAVKDFVPPAVVDITNCGSIEITKRIGSVAGTLLDGVAFTLYKDVAPLGGTRGAEDTTAAGSCVTGALSTGVCKVSNVPFGDYWVVETTPTGYTGADPQLVTVSSSTPNRTVTFVNQVATTTTSLSTTQRWLPNHETVISLDDQNWGTLAGTLTFEMYESDSCGGTMRYTETVDVTGARDLDGTPGGYTATVRSANTTVYTSTQEISWKVTYDPGVSRPNQVGAQNVCDKSDVGDFTNFTSP